MQNFWRNSTLVLVVTVTLLLALLLNQCNNNRDEKQKRVVAERIAEQNMKAIGDSTIQLKMTREQLAASDSMLSAKVKEVETLVKSEGSRKDRVREVVVVKPVVIQKDVEVYSYTALDPTDSSRHLLTFSVNDYVKSFHGVSSFRLTRTDSTINILPGLTKISDFKLNFDFAVVKYDDATAKVTRYKIIPYYTDATGNQKDISDQVKFNFRGAELLDKPWQENTSTLVSGKKRVRVTGAWGLGINPIGLGPVVKDGSLKLAYTPSISFGYFITLQKR